MKRHSEAAIRRGPKTITFHPIVRPDLKRVAVNGNYAALFGFCMESAEQLRKLIPPKLYSLGFIAIRLKHKTNDATAGLHAHASYFQGSIRHVPPIFSPAIALS